MEVGLHNYVHVHMYFQGKTRQHLLLKILELLLKVLVLSDRQT